MTNYRIRVSSGNTKYAYGQIRSRLGVDPKVIPKLLVITDPPTAKTANEFVIDGVSEDGLKEIRAKLSAAGLVEISGSTDATIPSESQKGRRVQPPHGNHHGRQGQTTAPKQPKTAAEAPDPRQPKPYTFVPVPENPVARPPIWHDGTSSKDRLSGEIRYELTNLTPLLVGWQRQKIGETGVPWPIDHEPTAGVPEQVNIPGVTESVSIQKSVLCALRAPWGRRPVLIPGDSLKGLLRHEIGALLGAPMERVAERTYSYRPNAMFAPKNAARRLEPRLARVPSNGTQVHMVAGLEIRVPLTLDILDDLTYSKKGPRSPGQYEFRRSNDPANGERYRGGLGAGQGFRGQPVYHRLNTGTARAAHPGTMVPDPVQKGYIRTIQHLIDNINGHFSSRHPDVGGAEGTDPNVACARIRQVAERIAFSPNDLVWVEWDTDKQEIVSIGWHYYYRWAYESTVRTTGASGSVDRPELSPVEAELTKPIPAGLTAVRRLFGYTGDNDGSAGIGSGEFTQLMGRVSLNAAIEIINDAESTDEQRFEPPKFLKELGNPRPSAVEFYLQQNHLPDQRPSDTAWLSTYGDASGQDSPGRLSGRKFYLDRSGQQLSATDSGPDNRKNERSTLAWDASKPLRKYQFTLRFRDLDEHEVASILLALSPNQFASAVDKVNRGEYCSKLGYARPLGWGTVRIESKQLLLLSAGDGKKTLDPVPNVLDWFKSALTNYSFPPETLTKWLEVHQRNHPDAGDYPRAKDKQGKSNIYTFHTNLRSEHSRLRRYRGKQS